MGPLTRRSLIGGALAGGGALLAPGVTRVLAAEPDGAVFEVRAGHGPVRAPRSFELLAVEWDAPRDVSIHVRTRRPDGTWSAWVPAPADHGHGPETSQRPGYSRESGTFRLMSEPIWVGAAGAFEIRSSRPLRGARVHLVAVGPATTARAAATRLAQPQLAAGPGQPPIIARSAWATSACRPRRTPAYGTVDVAFVHHTAGTNYYTRAQSPRIVRAICLFHRNVNGWNDIGYNFLVDRYGQIFEGRQGGIDEPLAGAQAGGYNFASTGIAMLGTFSGRVPTARAMTSLAHLLAWKLALHGIDATGRTTVEVSRAGHVYTRYRPGTPVHLHRIAGHRDGDTTTCPGSALYRRLPRLRNRVANLQGPLSELTIAATGATAVSGTLTSAGAPVPSAFVELQRQTHSERQTIATATTAADGSWSADLPLVRNAGVRALYRGAPDVSAVVSAGVDLLVPARLTLQVSQQQAVTGIPIVFSGTVNPAKDRIVLVISQLQLDGSYSEVRSVQVAAEDGSFSRGIAFSAAGQYQVVARNEPDAANAAGTSAPVAITVA